jgi:hypothetical protein
MTQHYFYFFSEKFLPSPKNTYPRWGTPREAISWTSWFPDFKVVMFRKLVCQERFAWGTFLEFCLSRTLFTGISQKVQLCLRKLIKAVCQERFFTATARNFNFCLLSFITTLYVRSAYYSLVCQERYLQLLSEKCFYSCQSVTTALCNGFYDLY